MRESATAQAPRRSPRRRRFRTRAGIAAGAAVLLVLAALVSRSGPIYCASVWTHATVAGERERARALRSIGDAENLGGLAGELVSSTRIGRKGEHVHELWTIDLGGRRASYEVVFHAAGSGCEPPFRSATLKAQP